MKRPMIKSDCFDGNNANRTIVYGDRYKKAIATIHPDLKMEGGLRVGQMSLVDVFDQYEIVAFID